MATKTRVRLTCLRDEKENFEVVITDESGAAAEGHCPHCGQRRKVIMQTSIPQVNNFTWIVIHGRYRRMTIY